MTRSATAERSVHRRWLAEMVDGIFPLYGEWPCVVLCMGMDGELSTTSNFQILCSIDR